MDDKDRKIAELQALLRLARDDHRSAAAVAITLREQNAQMTRTLKRIADALMTGERGEGLIEVARNAAAAEMELAARIRAEEDR